MAPDVAADLRSGGSARPELLPEDSVCGWVAGIELALARHTLGVSVLALACFAVTRGTDPHGGMYAFVLGGYLLPFAAALWLAGAGLRRRWRLGWLLQALPPAVFFAWKLAV